MAKFGQINYFHEKWGHKLLHPENEEIYFNIPDNQYENCLLTQLCSYSLGIKIFANILKCNMQINLLI